MQIDALGGHGVDRALELRLAVFWEFVGASDRLEANKLEVSA